MGCAPSNTGTVVQQNQRIHPNNKLDAKLQQNNNEAVTHQTQLAVKEHVFKPDLGQFILIRLLSSVIFSFWGCFGFACIKTFVYNIIQYFSDTFDLQ